VPLCNHDAPITSQLQVSSNVDEYKLSSGERRRKGTRDETKMGRVLFWRLILLIQDKIVQTDEAVDIQLKLNLFSWASFFRLIFELDLEEAFRPIYDST